MLIVYLTAPWCVPCKTMLPKVQKLVDKAEGVTLRVVDISHPSLAVERIDTSTIMSVPTLVFPETGEMVPASGIIARVKQIISEQEN